VGGSRLAGRGHTGLVDALYVEDRAFVSEPLDLTDELAIIGKDDGRRESGWRKANLAIRALILAAVVGLTFAGGAILVWWLASGGVSSTATRTAHAYLLDVKDANFTQAYEQLCAPSEPIEAYTAQLAAARARGHGVASFRLDAALTTATSDGTASTTNGRVTFADGSARNVTFVLEPASAGQPSCLDTQDNLAG
jgi:hypothetical protein